MVNDNYNTIINYTDSLQTVYRHVTNRNNKYNIGIRL